MSRVYDLLVRARGETGDAEAAMRELQNSVGRAGRRIEGLGRSMTLGVTVPVVAAGAASFKAFANFDQTMRQVGVTTQASASEMDRMRDTAKRLGQETSFSAQEVANAMLELSKGGVSQAQMSAGVLKETLTLAAAGGLELGASASYMTNTLNAFGLKATNAAGVAAALAGGANASTASVESLGMGLAQVSAQANTTGLSMNETIAALAAFDAAGIKGSDAGTSLKTMLQRLVPTTDKARDAMEALGLRTTDAQGNFLPMRDIAEQLQVGLANLGSESERAAALQAIFGSDASRAASILGSVGAEGIDKYTSATKNMSAAQELAKTNTSGASGSIEQMMGSIETAAISIGETLAPTVISAANAIGNLADKVSSLPPEMQQLVVTAGIGAAAMGPLLIVVGQVTQGAAALAPALTRVGTALRALAAAAGVSMAVMGPLALAVTAVAVASAALVLHERNKANAFRDTAAAARDQIAAFDGVAAAQARVAGAQLSAKEASLSLQQAIVARDSAEQAHGRRSLEYRQAVLGVARAWRTKQDAIANASKVAEEEGRVAGRAGAVAKVQMQRLRDEIQVRRRLTELQREQADKVGQVGSAARSREIQDVSRHLKRLERGHSQSLGAVKDAYSKGLLTRQELVAAGLAKEVGIVVRAAPRMRGAGKRVGDAAAAGARSSQGAAREAGRSLAQGMESGLLSGVGGLIAATQTAVRQAVAAGKREADAHSPSRRTAREIGAPFSQGIAVGIRAKVGEITAEARAAVRAGMQAGRSSLGGFQRSGFSALGDIANTTRLTGAQALTGAVRFASASSSEAFTITQNSDGTASVSENTDITAYLRQRRALNQRRLSAVNGQRNRLVSSLTAARRQLTAANRALGRARRSGTRQQIAAAQRAVTTRRNAVGSIEGQIEGLEQEIVQLGGQIQQDTASLEAPDVSEQNAAALEQAQATSQQQAQQQAAEAENFRRRALGLMSVEEEVELARANEIRAQYGLPPVSSMSQIGSNPTQVAAGAAQLQQQSLPQHLLPTSQSAAGAVRDAAMRAMTAGGATVNVYPQSGDPEAIANRVAMILGSSMLRSGGTL